MEVLTICSGLFKEPHGIAVDRRTGDLYVCDSADKTVKRVYHSLSNSRVYSVEVFAGISGQAGHKDGHCTSSLFNTPHGIAADDNGFLFVSDSSSHIVRKIDIDNKQVTTLCGSVKKKGSKDGYGENAKLSRPRGIVVDKKRGYVYIAEPYKHRIRQVELATRHVSVLCGGTMGRTDGYGEGAAFISPLELAIDSQCAHLYVSDAGQIRKVELASTNVITYQKNAIGLREYQALTLDADEQYLYISDHYRNVIQQIQLCNGMKKTFCGSQVHKAKSIDGNESQAKFAGPLNLVMDNNGDLIISETRCLRKINIFKQYNLIDISKAAASNEMSPLPPPSASPPLQGDSNTVNKSFSDVASTHCDLRLVMEGKVLECHKSVLSDRSEYFKAVLQSEMWNTIKGKLA